MSMLEGFIKPETTINQDVDAEIDMSKTMTDTHNTYNGTVVNVNEMNVHVDKLIIADERLASQLIAALTKEKSTATQTT